MTECQVCNGTGNIKDIQFGPEGEPFDNSGVCTECYGMGMAFANGLVRATAMAKGITMANLREKVNKEHVTLAPSMLNYTVRSRSPRKPPRRD